MVNGENPAVQGRRRESSVASVGRVVRSRVCCFQGKSKEQKRLIDNLAAVYQDIAKEKGLAMGDFPDPSLMREKLEKMDFTKFPKLDKKTPEKTTTGGGGRGNRKEAFS